MFKLNVKHADKKTIKERLNVVETPQYKYVLTDDKESVEDDKINIVFPHAEIPQVSSLLDWIVKGEELYITGYNQFGQKRVECRNIQYFIVETEDVFAVLHDSKLIVKLKLYEIEELLQHKEFIRVSKYCLVNIGKIEYIRSALNSKLDLQMKNGDHCEVNRSYLKDFKAALEL
ncbi:LytTR family DNA-binding domain-containing protein [Candidatus Xianfuyuplasma coldseepsis]|uniref:LytTR family transcriptional regulator n=1 Tax=Candidatus Xianfuyuplasma coldseepsis TaxID=2782163 RepID=A0A7L7KTD0_9MOLU|nr:LytTR family DNA-binding domain-containing protein [Xianfuyuplasma coldseepsis]QMS85008.1 LytTR family transcriptional regulator [Xianfuyuplasma coldseepsis]